MPKRPPELLLDEEPVEEPLPVPLGWLVPDEELVPPEVDEADEPVVVVVVWVVPDEELVPLPEVGVAVPPEPEPDWPEPDAAGEEEGVVVPPEVDEVDEPVVVPVVWLVPDEALAPPAPPLAAGGGGSAGGVLVPLVPGSVDDPEVVPAVVAPPSPEVAGGVDEVPAVEPLPDAGSVGVPAVVWPWGGGPDGLSGLAGVPAPPSPVPSSASGPAGASVAFPAADGFEPGASPTDEGGGGSCGGSPTEPAEPLAGGWLPTTGSEPPLAEAAGASVVPGDVVAARSSFAGAVPVVAETTDGVATAEDAWMTETAKAAFTGVSVALSLSSAAPTRAVARLRASAISLALYAVLRSCPAFTAFWNADDDALAAA